MPASRAMPRRGFERHLRAGDHARSSRRPGAGRPAWAFVAAGLAGGRRSPAPASMPIAREDRAAHRRSVVGSATVGPEAITAGSSPGTSEISSVTTRAGCAAAASRPPLIADRCFARSSSRRSWRRIAAALRLTACLSRASAGRRAAASSAEPPPEIRQSTRSSAVEAAAPVASMRRAACGRPRPAPGCAASTISMLRAGRRVSRSA